MEAAEGGHASVVRVLLAAGADVNAASSAGETALMIAANNKHTNIVNILETAAKQKAASSGGRKKHTRKNKKRHK